MKLRVIATLALVGTLGARTASAQSIGVFFDPNGATCAATVPQFGQGTMYVLATLGGPSSAGMTGAEFRVDNWPATWFGNPAANPAANLTLGSPLGTGANIAFPSCQAGAGGVVLLYSVPFFAPDLQANRSFSVQRHSTPSNLNFQCPLQTLCDGPVFTKICVNGGSGVINGGNCTVAVEDKSWSTVKGLYGN